MTAETPQTPQTPQVNRGGKGSMVPAAEIRTYYDRPVIKPPVWTWEIPTYFFTGGIAGGAAVLVGAAELAGNPALARSARRVAAAATLPSPALLVSDLGRPERFHHMLRVFKPTSPMSVGSWILAAFGPAAVGAAVLDELGRLPKLRGLADTVGALLGPAMSTYTAALVANTAVPVWHDARRELPAVFAASAVASAGAATTLVADPATAVPARRMMVGGAVTEMALSWWMEHRLGDLSRPYEEGSAGGFKKAAAGLFATGAVLGAVGGRGVLGRLGGVATLAGAWCARWAVFKAGTASAEDPVYTVGPQRERANALGQ